VCGPGGDGSACAPTADPVVKAVATITARRTLVILDEVIVESFGWATTARERVMAAVR
jgi:hypothetical protein